MFIEQAADEKNEKVVIRYNYLVHQKIDYNTKEFAEIASKKFLRVLELFKQNRCNILIVGTKGQGKSSLILSLYHYITEDDTNWTISIPGNSTGHFTLKYLQKQIKSDKVETKLYLYDTKGFSFKKGFETENPERLLETCIDGNFPVGKEMEKKEERYFLGIPLSFIFGLDYAFTKEGADKRKIQAIIITVAWDAGESEIKETLELISLIRKSSLSEKFVICITKMDKFEKKNLNNLTSLQKKLGFPTQQFLIRNSFKEENLEKSINDSVLDKLAMTILLENVISFCNQE